MNARAPNLNYLWAHLMVEELVRCGVAYFSIAPGSRSSPLAIAAGSHRRVRATVHFDERGLAYHALGWARATGRPAAVITTSGTALANLAPAIVEAAHDHIPLLVITADRPPELRETGANQTIDQVKFFGSLVRWQMDLPCPDAGIPARMLLTTVDQAVYRATRAPAGPVHLNCMFREPLAPFPQRYDKAAALQGLDAWLRRRAPFTTYAPVRARASGDALEAALAELKKARRGVVVAGALSAADARAAERLAAAMGWPLLPDIRSGLRCGAGARSAAHHASLLLASERFAARNACDAVLHLGGSLVSRQLLDFVRGPRVRCHVLVADFPERLDPAHGVTHRIEGGVAAFCRDAVSRWTRGSASRRWVGAWRRASRDAAAALDAYTGRERALNEPLAVMKLARLVPAHHALFLGNSLPVRLFDAFAHGDARFTRVAANRGASGIDGLLASATGFAEGSGAPVTLVLGDLSLLHDLNSLALLKASRQPVIAVVLNNDGGGIFSFLPIAASVPDFERLFGTPHGLTFAEGARMFGLPYAAATTAGELTTAYARAVGVGRSTVIEVRVRRADTVKAYREIQRRVARGNAGRA